MARQVELAEWIVEQSERLDLRCTQYSWIAGRFPGWFDIGAKISISGRQFVGRGADLNGDTALAKAFCEAVERAVCFDYGIRSTGVAGHASPAAASENASSEFYERLSLYLHSIERRPLSLIESSPLSIPSKAEGADVLELMEHKFRMLSPVGQSCICVLIEGLAAPTEIGGLIGLGCHRDEEIAIRKARIEAMANAEALSLRARPVLSKAEFDLIKIPKSADRKALLLNPEYLKGLTLDLFRIDDVVPLTGDLPSVWLEIENLPIRDSALAGCPLAFARAKAIGFDEIDLEFFG